MVRLKYEICLPYLDDNLVHSQTFKDHLNDLRRVLQHYKSHRVKLTPRKCELFKNQVRFLGRLVTKRVIPWTLHTSPLYRL